MSVYVHACSQLKHAHDQPVPGVMSKVQAFDGVRSWLEELAHIGGKSDLHLMHIYGSGTI